MSFRGNSTPKIIYALLLFVFCDLLLLFWEIQGFKALYYTIHSGISIGFLIQLVSYFKNPALSLLDWIYVILTLSILTWVMITLGKIFSLSIENDLLASLFYINGFLLAILAVSSFIFASGSVEKTSTLFFVAVLGLILSDLILFIIYFTGFSEFRFIDNFFYILGTAFLVRCVYEIDSNRKIEIDTTETMEKNDISSTPEKQQVYS